MQIDVEKGILSHVCHQ